LSFTSSTTIDQVTYCIIVPEDFRVKFATIWEDNYMSLSSHRIP